MPDHPSLFSLPTIERPSRIFSQQRRALNLVHALFESGAIRGRGLLVIGGGFGGLTAAAYAAVQGARVTLIEREDRLLKRFERSQRYLHPHMYDWPSPGWDVPRAGLPVLDWEAGEAATVAKLVCDEFGIIRSWFDIDVRSGQHVVDVRSDSNGVVAVHQTASAGSAAKQTAQADVAILALGFGPEKALGVYPPSTFPQYWDAAVHNGIDLGPNSRIHVIGNGDGALADLIGLALTKGAHSDEEIAGNFVNALKALGRADEVLKIEDEVLKIEDEIRDRVAAGLGAPDDYEKRMLDVFSFENSDLACRLEIEGRSTARLDVSTTYAANRALFLRFFGENTQRMKVTYSSRTRDVLPLAPLRLQRGPFVCLNEQHSTWVLYRGGPESPVLGALPKVAEALKKVEVRARLELSERPTSRAAWSRTTNWIEKEQDRAPGALPRVLFASEWTDSYVQRVMSDLLPDDAVHVLRGLLRVYAELAEELLLTDAAVFDGRLLVKALEDSPRVVEKAVELAREPTLTASYGRFLLKRRVSDSDDSKPTEELWEARDVELSILGGKRRSPLYDDDDKFEHKGSLQHAIDEALKRSSMSELKTHIEKASEVFSRRVRLMPARFGLRVLEPQSGLAAGLPDRPLDLHYPRRDGSESPSRSLECMVTISADHLGWIGRSKGNAY